jgi:hypothetical protein
MPAGSPQQVFDDAVRHLNARAWNNLAPLLHDLIVVDHLHTNGKSEFGRNNAIAALQACNATMQNVVSRWDGHNCIFGYADWVAWGKSEPIRFIFLFTDDGQDNWIIDHLYSVLLP